MKEEELIKKLESTELPDVELESHRRALKMALLNSDYSKKNREATFLETVKVRTSGVLDTISGAMTARRPVWRTALTTVGVVVMLAVAFFSIPQASNILKSGLFPEGSRTITDENGKAIRTQLNDFDQRASDILMADAGVKAILAQGAVIDKILPIKVVAQVVNPETGKTEQIEETWAQAWLVLGSKDWGVQIDLVRGQVVSITP